MRNQLNRAARVTFVVAIVVSLLLGGTGYAAVTPEAQRTRLEEPGARDRSPLFKEFARIKRLVLRALEELGVPKP